MKLLYVLEHISTVGGLERILIDKMNAMAAEDGFDVVLMTIWQDENRPAFPLDKRVEQVCLGIERPQNSLGWLASVPKVLYIYNNKVRAIAPDVLINFRAMGAMLTAFSSWKGYTVFEAHTARHYSNHRWLYPFMEHRADVVVCLTNGDAQNYAKAKRVEVIPNFVTTSSAPSCERGNRCLFVGRLCQEKDPLRLLRLWKEIVGRHPGWHLDICGEGVLEKDVRAEIERLSIVDITKKFRTVYFATCASICGTAVEISFSNIRIVIDGCIHQRVDASRQEHIVAVHKHKIASAYVVQCCISGGRRSLVALLNDFYAFIELLCFL